MKNKFFQWLSLLITLSAIFHSCQNEDFTKSETTPQRNNADFFKHSKNGSAHAKSGVDYVDLLEAYNRENDFLSTLPDQEGMPIWEKMQVLDVAEKTILYVPLSADDSSLSSLILVTVDENNAVSVLRNFTNDYLKIYAYNTEYPANKRRFLVDTFLQIDYLTFKQQRFTNLPTDLYEGVTEYNRLNILEITQESMNNGKFIYGSFCATIHACVNGCTLLTCDYNNCQHGGKCKIWKSCTNTVDWVDDPSSYPYNPTCGPGCDGGGGGTPGSGGPRPTDPCAPTGGNKAFYRMMVGCGINTGGDDDDTIVPDPCKKITTENTKAKTLLNQSAIAAQNGVMKTGIATNTVEKAFLFGKNPAGQYTTSNIIIGAPGGAQVSLPPTDPNFTAEGGIHNHTNAVYEVPSPGDVYWFMQNNYQNSSFDYYFVNGALGSTYAFVITNQTDFDNFPINKPPSQYFDSTTQSWNITKDIGIDFEFVYKYFRDALGKSEEESTELATAFVIGKYNMGMGLSKKDTNGNFKPIFVKETEIQIPSGNPSIPALTIKTYTKTNDCNLK